MFDTPGPSAPPFISRPAPPPPPPLWFRAAANDVGDMTGTAPSSPTAEPAETDIAAISLARGLGFQTPLRMPPNTELAYGGGQASVNRTEVLHVF